MRRSLEISGGRGENGAGHVLLRDINSMQQNQIPITTLCYYFHSLKLTSDKLWWEIFIAVLAKSESVLTKRTSDYVDLVELHFLPLLLNYLSSTPTITHTIRQNMFTIVGDAIKSHSAWLYNHDEFWKCSALGSIRFQWLHIASDMDTISDKVLNQAFSDIMSTTTWNDVDPTHITNSLMAMPFIITTYPYSVQYQTTPPNVDAFKSTVNIFLTF